MEGEGERKRAEEEGVKEIKDDAVLKKKLRRNMAADSVGKRCVVRSR